MTNLETALKLASRKWHIFPCGPDKRPLTPHGMNDSTTLAGQIKYWWGRWPEALVGIACEPSGIFCLDIDCHNGIDGKASWSQLVNIHNGGRPVPCGPAQHTPSGGYHLIFRLPVDINVPNSAGRLGPGLDLRSKGYICTGSGYTWYDQHGPETQLTDAPAWLLGLIDHLNPRKQQREYSELCVRCEGLASYFLERAVREARAGNRNHTGFWLALQLRDAGLFENEAIDFMLNYARRVPQGDHPYTDDEAQASLTAAYSRPRREPAGRKNGRT